MRQEHRAWQRGRTPLLINLFKEARQALRHISKELVWKVHFELSQASERAAEVAALGLHLHTGQPLQRCRDKMLCTARQSLVRSLLMCPSNLRWRVLLVGARMEISVGSIPKARTMLRRAFNEAPAKSKAMVYLECSRVEEFVGDIDTARSILQLARTEVKGEWKVFLESVLLEARAGSVENAIRMARSAVHEHPGTGRLWAILIQLYHRMEYRRFGHRTLHPQIRQLDSNPLPTPSTPSLQMQQTQERDQAVGADQALGDGQKAKASTSGAGSSNAFHSGSRNAVRSGGDGQSDDKTLSRVICLAVMQVPKSGEVWCERGRCQLNPLNTARFNLHSAQQSLNFAIQFTPQYGDTFIEYGRLEMLCQVLLPRVLLALRLPVDRFLSEYLSEDVEADIPQLTKMINGWRQRMRNQSRDGDDADKAAMMLTLNSTRGSLDTSSVSRSVDTLNSQETSRSFSSLFGSAKTRSATAATTAAAVRQSDQDGPSLQWLRDTACAVDAPVGVPAPYFDRQQRRRNIVAIEKMRHEFGDDLLDALRNVEIRHLRRR